MDLDLIRSLADAAADAYVKPEEFVPLEDNLGQCRGFMRFGYGPLIAIRGTASLQDALVDGKLYQTKTIGGDGIHTGFLQEFESIQTEVFDFVRSHPKRPVNIAGHSLGGAIATILAMELAKDGYEVNLLTLGSPRVGNAEFVETYEQLKIDHVRIVHGDDIVPRLPKLGYKHVCPALHINSDGYEVGPVNGLFRWLLFFDEIFRSDLNGTSIAHHRIINYLLAIERYTFLQSKNGGAK